MTFAGKVQVAQEPTLDRAASTPVVDGLKLSYGTLLYDGLEQAVRHRRQGRPAQRHRALRRPGHLAQTSRPVTAASRRPDVKVDVVALAQSAGTRPCSSRCPTPVAAR